MNRSRLTKFWMGMPPWLVIGALAVLFPILAVMTFENIHRQKENTIRLLLEKGAALIRSFEAGTRTGMHEMQTGTFKLQRLLTETAQQPDIEYLIVTNVNGVILAHNDPSETVKVHGRELRLSQITRLSGNNWRIVSLPDGKKIFEVYRRFLPTGKPLGIQRFRMMLHRTEPDKDKRFPSAPLSPSSSLSPQLIFVGLDMSSIEDARKADTRHTIIMAVVLLLIGLAGILLLFLAQSYRSTQASLSRIKAFSDTLVENMPIGLLAINAEKQLTFFNQVAGVLIRNLTSDSLGSPAETVLPPELLHQLNRQEIQTFVIEEEIDCTLADGGVIPLEITISALKDERGYFWGYVVLFKDLSEVRELRKEIARSQRLASVGRLAAGVAHEIRNPLSSIKGFATYFKERYRKAPKDQEISNIMIQEVDRLNRVVGQLLEFSRPISISKNRADIETVIKNSLKLVEHQANESGIRIEIEIDENIDTVEIDSDRINQVLLNLYLNAIDAMANGGRLTVSISKCEEKKELYIEVTDSGDGIKQEDIGHVFDPYFTTKTSGTGLGLAIANNIIEAHDGKIKVESLPGKGTSITILLPYATRNANEQWRNQKTG